MGNPRVHAGTAVTGTELEAEAVEVVRPGATLPGQRRYFAMPDGTTAVRELSSSETAAHALITAPPGGSEIDPAEGVARVAAGRQALAELRELERGEAAQVRAADHRALVALGLPEETARRLSGHR